MLLAGIRPRLRPGISTVSLCYVCRYRSNRARQAGSTVPFLSRFAAHGDRLAVESFDEKSGTRVKSTYSEILSDARRIARGIREALFGQEGDGAPPRVAVIMPRDRHYVSCMTAVWLSSCIFVPIHIKHPPSEVQYILHDSAVSVVLVHPQLRHLLPQPEAGSTAQARSRPPMVVEVDLCEPTTSLAGDPDGEVVERLHGPQVDDGALLIYTSGTTGRPKGVLSTHRVLGHQIESLVQAWQYQPTDRILHLLPLHHLHGLLNKLLCVLWAGGTVEFAHDVRPEAIWQRLAEAGQEEEDRLSLFMAVPTIYARMMHVYKQGAGAGSEAAVLERAVDHLRSTRLLASGSAALPQGLFRELEAVLGRAPLERYGMTELGMVLSNPLEPSRRVAGHVGCPMPEVTVRLVDPETGRELGQEELELGASGELRVKGPTVFVSYWRRPQATREAFDDQGWFKTGDVAVYNKQEGSFRLLGRLSSDIIKTGGYKVSAIEVEEAIREHPQVVEAVVLGRADPVWGEVVTAVIRTGEGPPQGELDLASLRSFLSSRLAAYKLPSQLQVVRDIPKNAMGKVNKKTLLAALGVE